MTAWAFLDHPGPIPFAHRGGAGDRPENTMGAFANAVALGYRYLETDVHTTADGVLVAFHDDVLDRVTDRSGAIAGLSWDEVRKAKVGDTDEGVPRLEDVLGTWPEVRVNVDPKHDASVEPLVEVLDRAKAGDRVCVTSFSDRRLHRFRTLSAGKVCTGMGTSTIARLRMASLHVPSGRLPGECSQVPVVHGRFRIVDARFMAAARRRNIPVHVWTVDDAAEMDRLLDLGVDGLMTDRPLVLKEVLLRRNLWT